MTLRKSVKSTHTQNTHNTTQRSDTNNTDRKVCQYTKDTPATQRLRLLIVIYEILFHRNERIRRCDIKTSSPDRAHPRTLCTKKIAPRGRAHARKGLMGDGGRAAPAEFIIIGIRLLIISLLVFDRTRAHERVKTRVPCLCMAAAAVCCLRVVCVLRVLCMSAVTSRCERAKRSSVHARARDVPHLKVVLSVCACVCF